MENRSSDSTAIKNNPQIGQRFDQNAGRIPMPERTDRRTSDTLSGRRRITKLRIERSLNLSRREREVIN
jgi:hypothetical protein